MSFVRKNNDDKKTSFGVIVGNRDIFQDNLVKESRKDILDVIKELEYEYVILDEGDTLLGVLLKI